MSGDFMKRWAKMLGLGADSARAETPGNIAAPDAAPPGAARKDARVEEVPPGSIAPNPFQPRKNFCEESLQELAQSIKEFGVLQPLLVRRRQDSLELIAGERRLRASLLAGLETVPVIVKTIDDQEMAELAMIENLQREDLHYLEEAEGFQLLMSHFGFTQEALARRLGKSQSTVANKLRLLKMAPEVRTALLQMSLTERHARALLKLPPDEHLRMVKTVEENDLNVRETEELVEKWLMEQVPKPAKQNLVKVIKDVRIFINTVDSVIKQMKKSGMDIRMQQQQDGEYVTLQIQVRNTPSAAKVKNLVKRN